jgi:hypothetical protein
MNLFELTDLMQRKGEMMRSNQFRRTPFTDWMDEMESVCPACGNFIDHCQGHIIEAQEEA